MFKDAKWFHITGITPALSQSAADLVDRVGGGDSFASALIYGLNAFEDRNDSLNFAVAELAGVDRQQLWEIISTGPSNKDISSTAYLRDFLCPCVFHFVIGLADHYFGQDPNPVQNILITSI